MLKNKNGIKIAAINVLLFIIFVVLSGTTGISLKIANASPIFAIALLVSLSMFLSETASAFSGFIFGAFMDATSALPFGFNSVYLLITALATALIIRHLFNNNLRSAIALCLIISLLYFFLRWLIGYSGADLESSLGYLIRFGVPSALYTTVFIIPFYYLEKFIFRKFAR